MYKLIFLLAILVASSSNAADMKMAYRGVIDGDTIRSTVKLPCPLCNVSVRIFGIDTPESNYLAKCDREKNLGIEARVYLEFLFRNKSEFLAKNVKWDKYGGRILADIELDGKNIADLLIEKGFAKKYFGQGPKPDWCG